MDFTQSFKMAFKQLVSNKMRSILTMLGIIIGVSSVTLLISVANGMQTSINNNLSSLGSNLITVNIMPINQNKKLTLEKSDEFKEILGVENLAKASSGNISLRYNQKEQNVNMIATDNFYEKVQNIEIENGRFLSPIDVEYGSKVVILGSQIAKDMFRNTDLVGKSVTLNGIPYKVIGVLKEQGSKSMNSSDNTIITPITSGQRLLKNTGVKMLYVSAISGDIIDSIINKMENRLEKLFGDKDSFNVFNQQQILDMMNSIQTTMKVVLGAISSISLIVGGIGIMNIMLVSVTERTKEIGIRKALGAKRKTILIQFLIESVLVSLLGGIIGAIIGIIGSNIIYSMMDLKSSVSWDVVLFSLGFSMIIGIVFGIMPANKASKLQPIQALRSE